MEPTSADAVESAVRAVYDFCPPTVTHYTGDGRAAYQREWARFLETMGLTPEMFRGATLLDVGCGSCEKATFYDDWGATVTAIDMTPAVIARARDVVGTRPITLIESSLFTVDLPDRFDVVVSDGVLHHTANTYAGLEWCVRHLKDNGLLLFSVVNVWGSFWWFKPARVVTRLLGGSDYHARARWGQRLFQRFRGSQEGAAESSVFFRKADSWAYDWFANPRWNAHSPRQLLGWLDSLGLTHVGSVPSLVHKSREGGVASLLRSVSGEGPRLMGLHWLASRQPNMVYILARKS